jgi:hypothetical protein
MAAEERFDGIHRREVVTDTWRRGYTAAFPTFAECRAAIAFPLRACISSEFATPLPMPCRDCSS